MISGKGKAKKGREGGEREREREREREIYRDSKENRQIEMRNHNKMSHKAT